MNAAFARSVPSLEKSPGSTKDILASLRQENRELVRKLNQNKDAFYYMTRQTAELLIRRDFSFLPGFQEAQKTETRFRKAAEIMKTFDATSLAVERTVIGDEKPPESQKAPVPCLRLLKNLVVRIDEWNEGSGSFDAARKVADHLKELFPESEKPVERGELLRTLWHVNGYFSSAKRLIHLSVQQMGREAALKKKACLREIVEEVKKEVPLGPDVSSFLRCLDSLNASRLLRTTALSGPKNGKTPPSGPRMR